MENKRVDIYMYLNLNKIGSWSVDIARTYFK